ncbi:MAG TPA: CRISPR-associated endonuclease Cas2 [Candidatus Paceibacterota bacterium]|nr:CRISPR-associated endonuclease Cas2 [Candidatus Paceibacterota bacterium]
MRRKIFYKNSKPHNILNTLLISGGVLTISFINPLAGALIVKNLIKLYFANKKFIKEKFLRDLKRLQERELIDYKVLQDGKIEILLTKRGKEKLLVYDFDNLKIKSKRWDGKWRLIVFDIPDDRKQARDALREKLKKLEFYQIQKSVYLTPYKCEDEIDFICSVFDLSRNNVLIFEVSKFEGEEKLKRHFQLL